MNKLVNRNDFPWFKNNPGQFFLDSSATSLKPQSVIDAIVEYYSRYSTNPHANDAPLQQQVVSQVEQIRAKVAAFINAEPDEVAFTSGATLSLNYAARAFANELHRGDEVILSEADHSSSSLPFYDLRKEKGIVLRFVPLRQDRILIADFVGLVTARTRVVVITSASNTLGFVLDVAALIKAIKKVNPHVLTIVDATQHVPHAPVDVKHMGCDFLAFSAHKLLGPTGIGVFFIKKELQRSATPHLSGGAMNFEITTDDYSYMENIHKFEAGTPNAAGIYGFGAAIDYLNNIGMQKIYDHDQMLKRYAIERLSAIPDLQIYNADTELAIVLFNYKGVSAQDLAFYLGKQGLICRSGLSCSKLVRRGLEVPFFVRASFYLYSEKSDVDALCNALTAFRPGDEISALF